MQNTARERYSFDTRTMELIRKTDRAGDAGVVALRLVAVNATRSFLRTAGKELANKLNGIEQGKEAAAASIHRKA